MTDQENLRNLAQSRAFALNPAQREALLSAADRIDEIIAQNKMLNRITTIDVNPHDANMEERIAAIEDMIKRLPSQMALEDMVTQLRAEFRQNGR